MPRAVLSERELEEVLGAECSNLLKDCIELPEEISLPDNEEVYEVSRLLKMLSSESKLEILALISQAPLPVSAIAKLTGKHQSLVSHHLSELKIAGLVREKRFGKFRVYAVDKDKVNGVCLRMQKLLGTTQRGPQPQR